ncbi:DUF2785 domain-containing protein [Acidaminobacter sp. JC074]|uniref:DUF2785 domain-containing protein n=1 Tax=Acidaminobacter sp. JC074 TaxID=2530199 RepID=UPI001F0D16D9|nr:DUF2785 domain-containing protein [Acidaminobacter sp. JC074]MCH4889957.1 DUF2785 domain-containing protein [Acidaminobacter sp. JC074]
MERKLLKKDLLDIKKNDYKLQGNKDEYIKAMMLHIGDPDPVLRDDLIYPTLLHWIEINRELDKDTLSRMFDDLLSDNYIFYNIDKKDETSVYRRTFSTLTLNPILCVHEEEPFLSEDQMDAFRNKMIDYINKENDFRGYDDIHGWAHAFAHWSDTNFFYTLGLENPTDMCMAVLSTIQNNILRIKTPLSREEDERLATNIVYEYIGESMITPVIFSSWLQGFNRVFEIEDKMHRSSAKVNVKHFLRSIYFRMMHLEISDDFVLPLLELEKKFNSYLY